MLPPVCKVIMQMSKNVNNDISKDSPIPRITQVELFQVRVRIIEGRQLSGSNISPVVRCTVANHTRQTKVKHSTNKPFFDEVSCRILPLGMMFASLPTKYWPFGSYADLTY